MDSKYPVKQLSCSDRPAIHAYYDIVPESPNREQILYYAFDSDEIPGPGHVICANRDGSEARVVSPKTRAIGHTGSFPQWHTNQEISFLGQPGLERSSVRQSLSGEDRTDIPGHVRQFNIETQQGLLIRRNESMDSNPFNLLNTLEIQDLNGRPIKVITTADAHKAYPHKDRLPPLEQCSFQNAKWSPDAKQFLIVFANQGYAKVTNQTPAYSLKVLMIGNTDGTAFRFLSDFGHHPMWSPDGTFIYAFERTSAGRQNLMKYPLQGEKSALIEDAPGVHASLHPNMRDLIVDVFNHPEEGLGSLMRYDLVTGDREILATFRHDGYQHETGCHPHPVWSRDFKKVYFNAKDTGRAQLYVMNLSSVV